MNDMKQPTPIEHPETTQTEKAAPSRFELLREVHKQFAVDVKNAAEQVAHYAEAGNAQPARAAFKILLERMERASATFAEAFPDGAPIENGAEAKGGV